MVDTIRHLLKLDFSSSFSKVNYCIKPFLCALTNTNVISKWNLLLYLNLRIEYEREKGKNVTFFLFAFYFMQLFISVRLNDLEPKGIKKGIFFKLSLFQVSFFYILATLNFSQCTYLMKFVSKLIYSFKFSNNKQTKPQHSATIVPSLLQMCSAAQCKHGIQEKLFVCLLCLHCH